jgi:hypothetical protein
MVQWIAKWLHVRKKPSLVLKVDIAQAFDSVSWPFLIELMEHMGFPRVWRDWVAALLSSASTKILLNGNPVQRICHAKGPHQGGPLSPFLFLMVMEVLNALIRKVEAWPLFMPLGLSSCAFEASFYADDLVWILCDIHMAHTILGIFEDSLGLDFNPGKCQLVPIRCSEEQVAQATSMFPCQQQTFPLKYLEMDLSSRCSI